jgi:hypothetical protein
MKRIHYSIIAAVAAFAITSATMPTLTREQTANDIGQSGNHR